MKLLRNILIATGAVLIGAFFYQSVIVRADSQPPLSQAHKQRIAANCTSAISSLSQLHRSDALLRVDRGQLYEFIGTKLMARLNSRLALNRLDAGDLVVIAAHYDKALASFRDAYKTYEERLSSVLKIDCTKQQEAFYYGVADVRAKRAVVYQRIKDLNDDVVDFYKAFGQFSQEYQTALRGVGNE